MAWLQRQTAQYTMTIKNMEMSKTDVAGVVKISLVFGV
jgi:type II secretory pathway component PulM